MKWRITEDTDSSNDNRSSHIQLILMVVSIFFLYEIVSLSKTSLGFDERLYLKYGLQFFHSFHYSSTKFSPLYALILASFFKFFHDPLLASRALFSVLGGMLTFPVYYISSLIRKKHAVYITLTTMLMPGMLVLTLYENTHLLFLFLSLTSIAFILRSAISEKSCWCFIAGIFMALAYLARLDGLIYFFLILAFFVGCRFYYRSPKYTQMLFFFLVAFLLTILPWQYYLFLNGRHLISTVSIYHSTAIKLYGQGVAAILQSPNFILNSQTIFLLFKAFAVALLHYF